MLVHPTPPTSPAGEEVLATSATSKTETTVTKEKIQEGPGEGKARMAEEEEHSTVAVKRTMPKKPVLRTRTRAVAGEETKTRKRKSLMTCENAVSKRLQFWKGKETSDTDIDSSSLTLNSPMKERKPESLVKKIFKQQVKKTEDEDDTPQSPTATRVSPTSNVNADDTISMFDDLFSAECTIDDHTENNFDMLYEEEEPDERRMSEKSVGEPKEVVGVSSADVYVDDHVETEKSFGSLETKTPSKENDLMNGNMESIEKVSRPNELEDTTTTSPNSNDVDKSTLLCNSLEKVEGKYKCDDCGKDFQFLTYLKAHKSKSGCINSKEKKKRPSMNFSKIIYDYDC